MPYNFEYVVKDEPSKNDYGHKESSDGESVVGSYHVVLPDTRTLFVKYTADKDSGFVAEVTFVGEAKYEEYNPAAYHEPESAPSETQNTYVSHDIEPISVVVIEPVVPDRGETEEPAHPVEHVEPEEEIVVEVAEEVTEEAAETT